MIPKFRVWEPGTEFMNDQVRVIINRFGSDEVWVEATEAFGWKEVDKKYLMQSTGLKDKNDVEIFEGDILGSENKDTENWYVSHHVVVWHDSGFMGKQICSSSYIGLDYWTKGKAGYVVIGNIYENPELLEAE